LEFIEKKFTKVNKLVRILLDPIFDTGEFVLKKFFYSHNYLLTHKLFKRHREDFFGKHTYLATGHKHFPELDLKNRFINSGFWRKGHYSYVTLKGEGFKLHEKNWY
jgi:hypothetical protein